MDRGKINITITDGNGGVHTKVDSKTTNPSDKVLGAVALLRSLEKEVKLMFQLLEKLDNLDLKKSESISNIEFTKMDKEEIEGFRKNLNYDLLKYAQAVTNPKLQVYIDRILAKDSQD